jgi:hypothetical protein
LLLLLLQLLLVLLVEVGVRVIVVVVAVVVWALGGILLVFGLGCSISSWQMMLRSRCFAVDVLADS